MIRSGLDSPRVPIGACCRSLFLTPLLLAALVVLLPGTAEAAPVLDPVAVSGPTNLAPLQSETQKVWVEAEGGTFELTATTAEANGTLSFGSGSVSSFGSTTTLNLSAVTAGAFAAGQTLTGPGIQTEPPTIVESVSNGGRTLALSQATTGFSIGTVTGASRVVKGVTAEIGAFHPGDAISGSGIPTGTEVEAVAAGTVTLSNFPTADGPQGLVATETSGQVDFDAEASELEARLDALPGLAVTVGGGPGDATASHPYLVGFGGGLADTDVEPMRAAGAGLTGARHSVAVTTAVPGGAGTAEIAIGVQNRGATPSAVPITLTASLPDGVVMPGPATGTDWACASSGTPVTVTCLDSSTAIPGLHGSTVSIPIEAAPGAGSGVVHVSVAAAGADATYDMPLVVSPTPAPPGIAAFQAGAYDENGDLYTQAGGHPYSASTAFSVNTVRSPLGIIVPASDPKNIDVALPPGFIGNPLAAPHCREDDENCWLESVGTADRNAIVGRVNAAIGNFQAPAGSGGEPVFNIERPFGVPAKFNFTVFSETVNVEGSLRSDGDYGLTVGSHDTPQIEAVYGAYFTFWGAPEDPRHDAEACHPGRCEPSTAPNVAFLTNPTDCAGEALLAPLTGLSVNSWQQPGLLDTRTVTLPAVTGCAALGALFQPSFAFQPASHQAASPSAFSADLTLPQAGLTDPDGLAAPELKKAVVTLPKGVNVNPSSANGLEACSEAQMGLATTSGAAPNPIRFDKSEPSCPDASKLGTVEAKSPLLEETLEGTIYLAAQDENPFHSLLALYLVIDSPKNGILVKLPGEVRPDPQTGQLTVTFDNNPQLPVEDLKLNFRGGGPRSPLATPAVCGTYTTHGSWTPWSAPESGPPAQTTDSFGIAGGPGGGACATREAGLPFAPSFEAGTTSTQAGAYAPLVIKLARKDGEQELTHLDFTLPPGLTGKLAGIPYCSDQAIAAAAGKSGRAEQASPSCPAATELGTVDTAAGVGPEPIHVGGHVYLAGPYEGARLSSVVVTPAVAGPFDLGNVVVRAPLYINPETAQITAKSDEIPHILRGLPLKLRSVEIKVDRQGFALNPTSCEPMTVTSSMSALNGGSAKPSSRFQVGGCSGLDFKPKLALKVFGKTNRNAKPRFRAVLQAKPGEANIARAQVNLPHSLFLEQNHIKTVCTRVQFAEGNGNGSACPKGSIYGHARAITPLLEKPLEGPVYLRSNGGDRKLPDLVAALNGQIDIALWGKVDSGKNHGLRNTFEVVPDAPVSKFILEMRGGKKGLLVNSENLCSKTARKRRAIVRFVGHNGKVDQFKPHVANQCGKRHGKKQKTHKRGRSR